jgi:histidyl-tRNA synthetase
VDLAYHGGSMKAQFKAVAQKKAEYAAFLGPDEVSRNRLTFKHQTSNATHEVALDDIESMLKFLGESA